MRSERGGGEGRDGGLNLGFGIWDLGSGPESSPESEKAKKTGWGLRATFVTASTRGE